jgi:hypothetical protein
MVRQTDVTERVAAMPERQAADNRGDRLRFCLPPINIGRVVR